jgi:hypothetical protein|tara:strand:- start:943 stop:1350 length:408 start_codon:yes stop_codon:yes gene_type:complete
MNEIIDKENPVEGPVVNEVEHGSSTFSPGQTPRVGSLERGQRWTVRRKQEAVLRLVRGESVELLSRELGVEMYRLEAWREKAMSGIETALKVRKGDPLQTELDTAMKRIGELTMQVELLEVKMEKNAPLARRRSH